MNVRIHHLVFSLIIILIVLVSSSEQVFASPAIISNIQAMQLPKNESLNLLGGDMALGSGYNRSGPLPVNASIDSSSRSVSGSLTQVSQSPIISNATVQNEQTSLTLPGGAPLYIYGFVTGGGLPSGSFTNGDYTSVKDVDGYLIADMAVTPNDTNSYTTQSAYYNIGGASVSGYSSYTVSYGSNGGAAAGSASSTFTVATAGSLVVVLALAGGEQSQTLSGIPNLTIDATNNGEAGLPDVVTIAHAYPSPGNYTVTEQTTQSAAGQDPNHAGDLIGVFVFVPGTAPVPSGTNLLINPGFENGLNGWSTSAGTAVYSRDLSTIHSGSSSLEGIETNTKSLGRLYQDITHITTPGNQYQISGWIKTSNVVGNAVIALDYVGAGGWTPVDGYVKEIGEVTGTQGWAFFQSSVFTLPTMPSDADALWFLFDFNNGSGTAWWDDVSLVCLSGASPTSPATATTITSSSSASVDGQSVTFTVTVSPITDIGTPTGTVSFNDTGVVLGTETLTSGHAAYTTSNLSVGNHTIIASYMGDDNFTGSTCSLIQIISPSPTSVPAKAGYLVMTRNFQFGVVTDIKGSWVVPAVSAPLPSGYASSAAYVGISGAGIIEQIGTVQDCILGVTNYYGFWAIGTGTGNSLGFLGLGYAVTAGDMMTAEVQYIGNYQFVLSLSDKRAAGGEWNFSTTQMDKQATQEEAEWIVEDPTDTSTGLVRPLDDFGRIIFSDASVSISTISNGQPEPISGPLDDPNWLTYINTGMSGAAPTELVGGDSFDVNYNASVNITTIQNGGASVVQNDGVTVKITGVTPTSNVKSVTISSANYIGISPAGVGAISLSGVQYYDINVCPSSNLGNNVIAQISITSSAVTAHTLMQYWDKGTWINVSNLSVSGTTISGDIPVSELEGTPIAIGNPHYHWWLWLLIGLIVIAVAALVTLLMLRTKKSKKGVINEAKSVKEAESQSALTAKTSKANLSDPSNRLQQLKIMLDKGLITQQDYDEQKKRY